MSTTPRNHSAPGSARGFAVVAAIFILVVLAGMGAYIASISSQQHIGSALDVEGSRALQAARSGMEWVISSVIDGDECPDPPYTLNATDFPKLQGFAVTVTCDRGSEITDGADKIRSYSLTATACNQPASGCPNGSPSANYIERQLTVQVVM